MSIKLALLFPALVCFALPAWSQAPQPTPAGSELPSGPLLNAPAEFSKWEISSVYPHEQPKKGKGARKTKSSPPVKTARPVKLVTTKTARVIHEERTDTLGGTTETWFDGGVQYTRSGNSSLWYRADGSPMGNGSVDMAYSPLPSIGYRDVDLIRKENYAGTISYGDRRCLVFVPRGRLNINLESEPDAQKKLKSMDSIAFVDAVSRLPVEVRNRGEVRTYQFDPPPKMMQMLPIDLTAQIKNGEAARTRLNEPADRPY